MSSGGAVLLLSASINCPRAGVIVAYGYTHATITGGDWSGTRWQAWLQVDGTNGTAWTDSMDTLHVVASKAVAAGTRNIYLYGQKTQGTIDNVVFRSKGIIALWYAT